MIRLNGHGQRSNERTANTLRRRRQGVRWVSCISMFYVCVESMCHCLKTFRSQIILLWRIWKWDFNAGGSKQNQPKTHRSHTNRLYTKTPSQMIIIFYHYTSSSCCSIDSRLTICITGRHTHTDTDTDTRAAIYRKSRYVSHHKRTFMNRKRQKQWTATAANSRKKRIEKITTMIE